MEIIIQNAIRDNMLNIYRDTMRNIRNPNRIPLNGNRFITSRYYNNPPVGGYVIDEEHNYIFPDDDDFTSRVLIDIVTSFGSPGNDSFLKTQRKNQIKSINYHKVKKTDILLDETCSICIDTFKCGEYHRTLSCSHSFHKKCIDRWFKKDHSECPMCRTKII